MSVAELPKGGHGRWDWDYETIRKDHKTYYGTRVPQGMASGSFEDMYADRTHFILELLQNAEDAIGRRGDDWNGSRSVSFRLSADHLRVGHFGDPFNEPDVRSICSIDDSTKKGSLTEIGRFGVGFKSVYAFTDRPEVHSGSEDFAIDHYVWPRGIEPFESKFHDETVFVLPFRDDVPTAYSAINDGLKDIGIQTLLFLRQIEEISWRERRWRFWTLPPRDRSGGRGSTANNGGSSGGLGEMK